MKNLVTCLAIVVATLGFSQSKTTNGKVVKETVKIENMSMTVTVDSAEDIDNVFKLEDVEALIEDSRGDDTFSFKIVCNGKTMSNGKKSYLSYKVDGDSSDPEEFLKSVEAIKNAAIKYYNNKD